MKKLSILIAIVIFSIQLYAQKYSIKVKFNDAKDTIAYMSYFYGKGQYYKDTAKVDQKGLAHFSKVDTLEVGMYSILLGDQKMFDFIIDDQEMEFTLDSKAPISSLESKGSKENEIFLKYMKFINKNQRIAGKLKTESTEPNTSSDRKLDIITKLDSLDGVVKKYIKDFYVENDNSFAVTFLKALENPTVPDPPILENGRPDSTFGFKYYKSHYFDNLDLTDERFLRTSLFHEKVMYYLNKLTYQDADSLIKGIEFILGEVKSNQVLFKYTLSYLTAKYERSEMMGMDAVFVHLVKTYYLSGKAPWAEEKMLKKMKERVESLEPLLIGKKAPNIIVRDTAQKNFIQLYNVKAKYTIVYIWSPDCGHCKKSTPELKKLYDKFKDQGVEVFGVGSEWENDGWIKFINKHDLNWINGSDGGDFKSDFRTTYDVFSTPQTYLLDENKVILSKKMNIESLEKILEYYIQKDQKEQKQNSLGQ